jgi:hypothetical protein
MNAIHLIQKDPKLAPRPECPKDPTSLWRSGFWAVSEAMARRLTGAMIYFHEKQDARAKRGGEIVDYELVEEGEYAGRIIFRFREDPSAKGKLTGRDGWSMEKKIVFTTTSS